MKTRRRSSCVRRMIETISLRNLWWNESLGIFKAISQIAIASKIACKRILSRWILTIFWIRRARIHYSREPFLRRRRRRFKRETVSQHFRRVSPPHKLEFAPHLLPLLQHRSSPRIKRVKYVTRGSISLRPISLNEQLLINRRSLIVARHHFPNHSAIRFSFPCVLFLLFFLLFFCEIL